MSNLPQRPLTPQEKKQYLLNKYVKRNYKVEDLVPKYAVFWQPQTQATNTWALICVCNTKEEALKEILWRKKFHETNDGDLVLDNDARFETFRDETQNVNEQGLTYEPTQRDISLNYGASNILQVIASSAPQASNQTGFRGMAYYTNMELDYTGYYKIDEVYDVSQTPVIQPKTPPPPKNLPAIR
jgi:hypothetical protein